MTDLDDSFSSGAGAAAPDLLAPVHVFRDWRVTDAGLCSPRTDTVWETRTIRAHCRPQTADDFVRDRHEAPGSACNCGIHALYAFSPEFSKVDYQGVSGAVTVWGYVQAHRHGVRAEYARVEVLGFYSRWTRRQKEAVRDLADRVEIDLVDLYDVEAAAHEYASPMPEVLIPREPARAARLPLAPTGSRARLVIVGS